jgi:hypothetical protein
MTAGAEPVKPVCFAKRSFFVAFCPDNLKAIKEEEFLKNLL